MSQGVEPARKAQATVEVYIILKANRQIFGRKILARYAFWLLNLKYFRMQ